MLLRIQSNWRLSYIVVGDAKWYVHSQIRFGSLKKKKTLTYT